MRFKVLLTVILIMLGGGLTVLLNGTGSNATLYQSEGVLIDFGNYNTVWTDVDFQTTTQPMELLDHACTSNSYTYTVNDSGKVVEINGVSDTTDSSWGLWHVAKGEYDAVRSESYDIDASDYTIVIWAYTSESGVPAVAVDATATSIYGYPQSDSTVTLSPVCTEIVGAVGASNTVVGTDSFSNYPTRIKEGHESGTISIVGTYTDPSYESILKLSPSMVICDGSQYNHVQMAKTVRNSSINAVVIYDAESVDIVLKNIFIVGKAMNYDLAALNAISELSSAVGKLKSLVSSESAIDTMIALSADPSPFVSGTSTYANDILVSMAGSNVFDFLSGWKNINSEYILDSNPSVIIIISEASYYSENNGSYERMLDQLSEQWKKTDAYKNGQIYLLCEDLGELAQRAGPRFAQFEEIVGRILHPEAFEDGTVLPKCIGNSYTSYLTITKSLGFDT